VTDTIVESGPLRRLAEEVEEDGVRLPGDDPLRSRRSVYGSLILPPDQSLLVGGDLVELHELDGYDRTRARSFADGRSTFLVHLDSGGDADRLALAHFRRLVSMEADLVEIQEATEAFIVQRTLLGRPRLFLPDAVVDWNGREWTTRANATALLAPLSKIAPAASYDVLRGLLELCVHWLSPGNTGATPATARRRLHGFLHRTGRHDRTRERTGRTVRTNGPDQGTRHGRRHSSRTVPGRLKPPRWQHRVGSNPTPGTDSSAIRLLRSWN